MTGAPRYAAISVAVAIVVLSLKTLAWWVTGSSALFADALESVVNLAASGTALWATLISRKPADAEHPFGHHKAEYLSAVAEGVLIVVAALSILWESWQSFQNLRMPDQPLQGIAINAAATTLNLLWAVVLLRQGKTLRSPALAADGRHLLADVVTSTGVIAALATIPSTGWLWLDPLLATLTAFHILGSGTHLVRQSVSGLLDEAVDPITLSRIKAIVSDTAVGAIEAHDMRTRQAGRSIFLDFHLVVPGEMPVAEAHAICDRIEAALKTEIEDLAVTIHVEPEGKAKSQGIRVLSVIAALLLLGAEAHAQTAANAQTGAFGPTPAGPAAAHAPSASRPGRIASINLCSDQYLLLLADPSRIVGVTPLASDPSLSSYAPLARGLPALRPEAEAVLASRPDLVLSGAWGSALTRRAIEARGIRVVTLPAPTDLDGIETAIRLAATAVGTDPEPHLAAVRSARARLAVVAASARSATVADAVPVRPGDLAAAIAGPRQALLWQARGFAAGTGTFPDAALTAAGFANAVPFAGYGYVPIETVLAAPPALLITTSQAASPSLATLLLAHPALDALGLQRRHLNPAAMTCATPRSLAALDALAR